MDSGAARRTLTVPVFFLSDSTEISAETMGNASLIQFPDLHFERRLMYLNPDTVIGTWLRLRDESSDRVTAAGRPT